MRRCLATSVAIALLAASCAHGEEYVFATDQPINVSAASAVETFASFAGGAVEFTYGEGLRASELPRGRQMLLVLSRGEPPQATRDLRDGMWIAFQPHDPSSTVSGEDELAQSAQKGIKKDCRSAEVGQVRRCVVDGYRGVEMEFTVPRPGPLFPGPDDQPDAASEPSRGWRRLVVTEAGIVEIHFVAPASKFAQRNAGCLQVLASMKLGSPRPSVVEVAPSLLDAEPVIGCWKSSRGLMVLTGGGEVILTYDRKKSYELNKLGIVDYEKPVKKLVGRFTADGDLIRIRWKDNSLLNIRWRVAGSKLLVTDHQGRTRRLSRIYR